MQARERFLGVARPSRGQRARQVVFFSQQIVGAIAHSFGVDEHEPRIGVQDVGEQQFFFDQPRQPTLHSIKYQTVSKTVPVLASPRVSADEGAGTVTYFLVQLQFSCRENYRLVEVVATALIVDIEMRQPVHFVAPQVDAHWGFGGARKDVDDRTAARHLATVLDELFAAVTLVYQSLEQRVGV